MINEEQNKRYITGSGEIFLRWEESSEGGEEKEIRKRIKTCYAYVPSVNIVYCKCVLITKSSRELSGRALRGPSAPPGLQTQARRGVHLLGLVIGFSGLARAPAGALGSGQAATQPPESRQEKHRW